MAKWWRRLLRGDDTPQQGLPTADEIAAFRAASNAGSGCPTHGTRMLDDSGLCMPSCGFGWPTDSSDLRGTQNP